MTVDGSVIGRGPPAGRRDRSQHAPGDRVALHAENDIETAIAVLEVTDPIAILVPAIYRI